MSADSLVNCALRYLYSGEHDCSNSTASDGLGTCVYVLYAS